MFGSLLGAALVLIGAGPAQAQRALDDVLGPATVAPRRADLVPMVAPPPAPTKMDVELMASDPDAIVRFIEADPQRLNVDAMDPALVLTLSQILLRADRTFLAERLMGDATRKWPHRVDLRRGWARVLISLGRPVAARGQLEKAVAEAREDPVIHYLLGRAWLAMEPRTPTIAQAAIASLEQALRINPQYADADGVTAPDIQRVIQQLRAGRAAPPGAP